MADDQKSQLDDREKVACYMANRFNDTPIHVLGMLYNVNQGRVSEAITAIEYTVNNTKLVYDQACQAKKAAIPFVGPVQTCPPAKKYMK